MIQTRAHDHGPEQGDGLGCIERRVQAGTESPHMTLIRGACLEDDGCARGAHEPYSLIRRHRSCEMPPDSETTYEVVEREDPPAPTLESTLESTPRRIALVGVLTDLMAVLDAELDDLAEVRRTDDRVIATDAEHAMDKLNVVWAKIAEARTAVRSCDLGHLPLPEVG